MKKIFLLVLIAFAFSSCEKDDICDANTETTPRLILEFYDKTNTTELKNVTNLLVSGVGQITDLETYTGVSKIELPLKITDDVTNYSLTLNSTIPSTINEDLLQFDYSRATVFVSRACGYKTVFTLNNTNNNIVTTDSNNWIDSVTITERNIDSENDVHIKIYF